MRKRIARIGMLAVLIIAAGGFGGWWWSNSNRNAGETTLYLYGNVEIRDAQLAFNEAEQIQAVLVEEGDRVIAGQVLARLNTARLEAQKREAEARVAAHGIVLKRLLAGTRPQAIEQARAEVEAARARVQNARQHYERLQKTASAGATAEQALDTARAQLQVEEAQLKAREKALSLAVEGPRQEDIEEARSRLEGARAVLSLFKVRLEDTVLKAPATGVIQSRILEPGEMAGPTRPALILALTDPKWVRAYVPEPNLGHLEQGMEARVWSDSFPGHPFDGRVGFIAPEAEFTPKNVETSDLRTKLVYEVRVLVQDPQNVLRLGMPVTVSLERRFPAGEFREGVPAATHRSRRAGG